MCRDVGRRALSLPLSPDPPRFLHLSLYPFLPPQRRLRYIYARVELLRSRAAGVYQTGKGTWGQRGFREPPATDQRRPVYPLPSRESRFQGSVLSIFVLLTRRYRKLWKRVKDMSLARLLAPLMVLSKTDFFADVELILFASRLILKLCLIIVMINKVGRYRTSF